MYVATCVKLRIIVMHMPSYVCTYIHAYNDTNVCILSQKNQKIQEKKKWVILKLNAITRFLCRYVYKLPFTEKYIFEEENFHS